MIKHHADFSRNPRMALMAKPVEKMDEEAINAIQHTARYMLNDLDAL